MLGPKIFDDLEVAGAQQRGDSAVVIRCRFKVLPLEQWTVRREYLRRIKAAIDASGIEIPYPHRTLNAGAAKPGAPAAAPLRLVVVERAFPPAPPSQRPA